VAKLVAVAIENAMAFREIAQLKDKLAEERVYLETEIRTEHTSEHIVGESPALRRRSSRWRSWPLPARQCSCSARRGRARS
jgi:transcriptional regulator with GAF, ATPase, and Fis domain